MTAVGGIRSDGTFRWLLGNPPRTRRLFRTNVSDGFMLKVNNGGFTGDLRLGRDVTAGGVMSPLGAWPQPPTSSGFTLLD